MQQTVQTLLIPAAGAGTRLRPATYATPKEMLRLVDRPIILYLLLEAYQAGIRRVVCIVHEDNRQMRTFFEGAKAEPLLAELPGMRISFVEVHTRGGDGQAILAAKDLFSPGEVFAVSMGDLLAIPGTSLIQELVEQYTQSSRPIISVETIPPEKSGLYGIIRPGSQQGRRWEVQGIVEKPKPQEAPSNLAMTGKYILRGDIFPYLETLQTTTKTGELKLANALNEYAQTQPLDAYACQTRHYDTGTKTALFETEVAFTLAHPELGENARNILNQHNH